MNNNIDNIIQLVIVILALIGIIFVINLSFDKGKFVAGAKVSELIKSDYKH